MRSIPLWASCLVVIAAVLLTAGHVLQHAFFSTDDYRYLALLGEVDAGVPGALHRAVIVENRWDQFWWIEDGTLVRFFRPLVAPAFALDRAIWGLDPRGFLATNLAIHVCASLTVLVLLRRLVSSSWSALLGAIVFALSSSRLEALFFPAARSDTLAVTLFMLGLLCWLWLRDHSTWRSRTFISATYGMALLGKEHNVLLPFVCLLLERWLPPSGEPVGAPWLAIAKRRLPEWICLAAVLAGYLVLRAIVLGAEGSGSRPFPYFFMPDRDGFALRTAAVWLQYCQSLVTGWPVRAFLTDFEQLLEGSSAWLLALSGIAVIAILAWGWRRPTGRFFAAAFLLTLVPILPLYSSDRYLYLASLYWCGLIALASSALAAHSRLLTVAFAITAIAPQAVQLNSSISALPRPEQRRDNAAVIVDMVRNGEIDMSSDRPIYLIDAPFRWLPMQFMQDVLDVEFEPGSPRIHVLCRSPQVDANGYANLHKVDDYTLEIRRPNERLIIPDPISDLEQRDVRVGETFTEATYTVTVTEVQASHAKGIRVRFDRPLVDLQLIACWPVDGTWRMFAVR
ncbi:MAG: hypothetical protein GY944_13965 [bacterium]|nr:hypothetical protein [bacterium]